VDESVHGQERSLLVCLRINVLAQTVRARVEPMRDICARCFDQWLCELTGVRAHQFGQVENLHAPAGSA
jgi:hypothetical protein